MKRLVLLMAAVALIGMAAAARGLVIYYSFTGSCRAIAQSLADQVTVDLVEVLPADENVDYAANGYAIGDALIDRINKNPNSADSYPAVKPVSVDWSRYDTVVIIAPLWWSHMAAPMQSFLFANGSALAGKNVGLIVSSHSSGIATVSSDARRLVPDGDFFSRDLWINRASHANRGTLISDWLDEVGYRTVTAVTDVHIDAPGVEPLYDLNGRYVGTTGTDVPRGIYVTASGRKTARL